MLRCLSDSELAGDGQRRDVGGLVCIAASLRLPAQTDKCEATLFAGTPGSLGRAGGGQEAAICGRAPLVHLQEVRASATREAANALWPA